MIIICQRLLSPCMPHLPSPLLPHPRLHTSGQQWCEQLRLLAARHPRCVSQRATSGSERGGGQPRLTFPEEHPQTALPLQGQLSSQPLIPRSTSLHHSPTQVLLLLLPVKALLSALFQNRDSEKKAAEGKGEAGAMRGVPIKQVCWQNNPAGLLGRRWAVRASLALAFWTEHPVEAERQLSEQRMEEEVCHAVQQWDSVLPLQCQRKDGPRRSACLQELI